jgi:phospholipase C
MTAHRPALRGMGAATVAGATLLSACAVQSPAAPDEAALQRIRHVVVIYAENHSFDNLYGLFPGAEGVAQASEAARLQRDHDGTPLKELLVFGPDGQPHPRVLPQPAADPRRRQ